MNSPRILLSAESVLYISLQKIRQNRLLSMLVCSLMELITVKYVQINQTLIIHFFTLTCVYSYNIYICFLCETCFRNVLVSTNLPIVLTHLDHEQTI